jgi:hypothetical protein
MQRNPLNTAHPQRQQRLLVLEPAVLPLHRATQPVQLLPPQRPARDQGVQPVSLLTQQGSLIPTRKL